MNRFLSVLLFLLSCSVASAQPVQQSGSITPGHPVQWLTTGTVGDAGTAVNGFLTGIGVVAQGPSICANSAPVTSGAYQQLCLSVTTGGPGQIILQNYGAAAPQAMQVVINGAAYNLPFSGSGNFVTGPVNSVIGDLPCWASTNGTQLNDCASFEGNARKVGTVNGSLANGHCVSIDSNFNFIDAGGPCTTGGGGGTVNSGAANNLAYYVSSGNAVSGLSNSTAGLALIEGTPPAWGTVGSAALSAGAAATNVGTLGGDLSGTLPNPTVAKVNGTSVPATPSANQALIASSGTVAAWGSVGNSSFANMNADTVKCNNTGSSAAPTDCISVITNDFTALATSKWFASDSPPANFIKYGDRFFGGDAISYPNTVTSGPPPFNATCSTGDWFSTYESTTSNTACGYTPNFAMVVESKQVTTGFSALNPSGAILGAGQTKENNFGGAFGIAGFAINNNVNAGTTGPAGAGGGWGGYFECDQTVNSPSAGCVAAELEAGNFVSDAFSLTGASNPPDPFAQAKVNSAQLGCASGLATPTPFKCAAAAQIVNVGNQFRVGLNILNNSIVAQTIFSGSVSPAIAMPEGYGIIWYSAAATPQGGFLVDGSNNLDIAAPALKMNGNTGVNCSGAPTSSFATVNGIVTHC